MLRRLARSSSAALIALVVGATVTHAQTRTAPLPQIGKLTAPVKVHHVTPIYPASARAAGIWGHITIEATIDVTGAVRDARIIHSVPDLDAPALAAVRQWRYTPATLDGAPAEVVVRTTVRYDLPSSAMWTRTWQLTAEDIIQSASSRGKIGPDARILRDALRDDQVPSDQTWRNVSSAISREFSSGTFELELGRRLQIRVRDLLESIAFRAPITCEPPSVPSTQNARELRAKAASYETWALLPERSPIVTGELTDVRYRMAGNDLVRIIAYGPEGISVVPRQGAKPKDQETKDWPRLKGGTEWATHLAFPTAGCWNIHVMRGNGAIADFWLDIAERH